MLPPGGGAGGLPPEEEQLVGGREVVRASRVKGVKWKSGSEEPLEVRRGRMDVFWELPCDADEEGPC